MRLRARFAKLTGRSQAAARAVTPGVGVALGARSGVLVAGAGATGGIERGVTVGAERAVHAATTEPTMISTIPILIERNVMSVPACACPYGPSPTERSPSSDHWASSAGDGAPSMRSDPDCVLGNAITSRIFVWLVKHHRPPVDAQRDAAMRRGAVLESVEKSAELRAHALDGVALHRERAFEELTLVDADAAAAELPAVEGQVVLLGCARPAGSSGDARGGRPKPW